jgi:uncharacterized surface protein with fasciclin (FAS1) repeats
MKMHLLTWSVVLSAALAGCSETPPPDAAIEIVDPSKKISPAGRESMDRRTEEAMRLNELNRVEVENKMSPYRYVISTDRYRIFSQLVKLSSHSRTIHSAGVTLLCPTNEAFDGMDNWKMLLRKGNQQELDDFVAHHVLPVVMTYEEFKLKESHTTLANEELLVSTRGGIFANDAHVRSGYISTENGNVIGLDDVAFVPVALR